MDESWLARRVMMAEVYGGRVRGRPRFSWMEGVMVALGNTCSGSLSQCSVLTIFFVWVASGLVGDMPMSL